MSTYLNTPVLFLIFNRPDITQQLFDQVKKVKPKQLYIAADGPRSGRMDDVVLCQQTREIVNQVNWNCEVRTLFRDENLGCGYAVCSAISWFFSQVEEGIILEDDCLPDLSFFSFCSELLAHYREDDSVYVISGTNLQNGIMRGNSSYYFSNYAITWGWATWRSAWEKFSYDIPDFEQSFNSGQLDHFFQSNSERKFWKNRLQKVETEKRNIWDYQWFYAIWKNRGLAITPNVNLVTNIGFRNNASHTFLKDSIREPSVAFQISFPLIHPEKKIDRIADKFTFKNAFSHSFDRFIRLLKENGFNTLIKYSFAKLKRN